MPSLVRLRCDAKTSSSAISSALRKHSISFGHAIKIPLLSVRRLWRNPDIEKCFIGPSPWYRCQTIFTFETGIRNRVESVVLLMQPDFQMYDLAMSGHIVHRISDPNFKNWYLLQTLLVTKHKTKTTQRTFYSTRRTTGENLLSIAMRLLA